MVALVGVSMPNGGTTFRFRLYDDALKFLRSDRILIRGQPANGFILAADKKGIKVNTAILKNGGYLQTTSNKFEISKRERKLIEVRPEYEGGHIRIPGLPKAWIDGVEFDPQVGEGERNVSLSRHPKDDGIVKSSTTVPINGHTRALTVPPAKPTVAYALPNNIHDLQADLAGKLADAREIIAHLEKTTGMKFTLDRNLRLVVALPADLRGKS